MGSDSEDEHNTVLDTLLADLGLMAVPAVSYQDGPRLDTLYEGPPTLDTTSTSGACGIDGLGSGSLVGGVTFASGGPGGPGLVEPLGLIICGLPAMSGAMKAPPLSTQATDRINDTDTGSGAGQRDHA